MYIYESVFMTEENYMANFIDYNSYLNYICYVNENISLCNKQK